MSSRTRCRTIANLLCAVCLCAVISGVGNSAETTRMVTQGWKPHPIIQGEGKKAKALPSDFQILQVDKGKWVRSYGLAQMDNGEVILLGVWHRGDRQDAVAAFSKDKGDTWSDWTVIPGKMPMMLAYLGKGNLTFHNGSTRYYSSDYGQTWGDPVPVPPASGGSIWGIEGNPLVDTDASGAVTWIAETAYAYAPGNSFPWSPADGYIRWSNDGGRTWINEQRPEEWYLEDTIGGKTFKLGSSEGGLVRAKNGWLIAALRPDAPARYLVQPNDDSLSGTCVSISKDNGKTWSPINILYDAGRHHSHLLRMPNGDIVMTLAVLDDIRDGKLASFRRGCDAIVSHDNGLTWELSRRYELDRYDYLDRSIWFDGQCSHLYSALLDDGRILTAYGNYVTGGAHMIRWKP